METFGLKNRSTISRILKNRHKILEKYKENPENQRKRKLRDTQFPSIEIALIEYMSTLLENGLPINYSIIQKRINFICRKNEY